MIEIGGKLFNRDHISAVIPGLAYCNIVTLGGDWIAVELTYDEVKATLNG